MNSLTVIGYCLEHADQRKAVLDSFFAQLDREASRHRGVVLSAENFGRAIALKDQDLLTGLNELASAHDVHIAYYMRPQHITLESSWRHWRSGRETIPSEFIERINRELHHFQTMTLVQEVAPRVSFVPRPCRGDLLPVGGVVDDFARVFIGLEGPLDGARYWENRGVPLEVANALTFMPHPLPWRKDQDQPVLDLVKGLLTDSDDEECERTQLAHLVLQQACHEHFEKENRKLIETLGWATSEWVPAVDRHLEGASFEQMNVLWQPTASAAELRFLRDALGALLTADQRKRESERDLQELRSYRSVRAAESASRMVRSARAQAARARRMAGRMRGRRG